MKENIVIYQDKQGKVELRADIEQDTIWGTQEQIARLFEVDKSVVSRHIRNIFKDGEIERKSNMQKMHNINPGRPITLYSLDIILSVGYRTNSTKAILFRKWSTSVLKEYLKTGYAFNNYKINKSPEKLEGLEETLELLRGDHIPGKLSSR